MSARFVWKCVLLFSGVVSSVSSLVASADAQTIAYEITALPAAGNQNFGGEVGMDFAVNEPITLTSFGAFDSGQNGLSSAITVRLWEKTGLNSGTQIASQLFPIGTPGTLEAGYRFIDLLDPLLLEPGDYSISASGYSAVELEGNENVGALAARQLNDGGGLLTFGISRFSGAAGTYPSSPGPFGVGQFDEFIFLGPSFQFQAVPEPSTLAIWGVLGLVGVAAGFWHRRRERKAA